MREKLLAKAPANGLLKGLDQPKAKEVLSMFKCLYYELAVGLKMARNNDLVKWISLALFRKYPDLFLYVCTKHKLRCDLSDAKVAEKAATFLIEDDQLNEQVFFAEQVNCFYYLQPESISIAQHEPRPLQFLGIVQKSRHEVPIEPSPQKRPRRFQLSQDPSRGISAYGSAEKDDNIQRVVEAVEQSRSVSQNLRRSLRDSSMNPNEFSFQEKNEVDQAFIEVRSSLQLKDIKPVPTIEVKPQSPYHLFKPKTPTNAEILPSKGSEVK